MTVGTLSASVHVIIKNVTVKFEHPNRVVINQKSYTRKFTNKSTTTTEQPKVRAECVSPMRRYEKNYCENLRKK